MEVIKRHNFIGGMFALIFMHVIVDVEGIVNVGEGSADGYQQSQPKLPRVQVWSTFRLILGFSLRVCHLSVSNYLAFYLLKIRQN